MFLLSEIEHVIALLSAFTHDCFIKFLSDIVISLGNYMLRNPFYGIVCLRVRKKVYLTFSSYVLSEDNYISFPVGFIIHPPTGVNYTALLVD